MTLLVTIIGHGYALACSDLRITASVGKRTTVVDESFNKHILFSNETISGNISYTGVAQWRIGRKTTTLHDVISASLTKLGNVLTFGPLCLLLAYSILRELRHPALKGAPKDFELHIILRHRVLPMPTIAVISTFRELAPWSVIGEREYSYQLSGLRLYLKVFEEATDVIFGGLEGVITAPEMGRIRSAVAAGANAFDASQMAAALIKAGAERTTRISQRAVSIVIPANGLADTNLWNDKGDRIVGFIPRMVFGDSGTFFGPAEFPVDLKLIMHGCLPAHSLFFKSIVRSSYM